MRIPSPLVAVFLAVASTGLLVAEQAPELLQAAQRGDGDAQVELGMAYAAGRGVPQDHVRAHMWVNLAAALGNERAREGRDLLAEVMTREQVAEAQQRAEVCLASGYRDC